MKGECTTGTTPSKWVAAVPLTPSKERADQIWGARSRHRKRKAPTAQTTTPTMMSKPTAKKSLSARARQVTKQQANTKEGKGWAQKEANKHAQGRKKHPWTRAETRLNRPRQNREPTMQRVVEQTHSTWRVLKGGIKTMAYRLKGSKQTASMHILAQPR